MMKRWPQFITSEPRVRDHPRQNPAVDQRDDRVVVAHHDQRRLLERVQPEDAGPPGEREKLIKIAEVGSALHVLGVRVHKARIEAEVSSIDFGRDRMQIAGIGYRRGLAIFRRTEGFPGAISPPGRGRRENEPRRQGAILVREFLGDGAAQDTPATSTLWWPSWRTSSAAQRATVDGR